MPELTHTESWTVEITCTGRMTLKTPSNKPEIKKAKGGPNTEEWNEDDCESAADLEGKTFDIQRFNDNWARYLNGEIWTKARLYDVAIFEMDEEDDEAMQESEEEEGESGGSGSEDVAEAASTAGEGQASHKRSAAEDPAPEDSTKRARQE